MSNHFHPIDHVKSKLFSELLPVLTGFTFISAFIFIYAKMGFELKASTWNWRVSALERLNNDSKRHLKPFLVETN